MRFRTTCLKIFSAAMILVLLTVRLGYFTQESFVTPVADCLFGSAFVSSENADEGKLRKFLNAHDLFDVELSTSDCPPVVLPETASPPCPPAALRLTVLPAEIYIPPEGRV